ncbi:uncharacterized protein LOC115651630 [Gopherus evgoodei]|uniref:uncharacterized protein LOC115651630 n=1 Tax=Gopherus evgoodei TaxID=1825980 RepID=UPI0011CEDED1|nr:uncharacterized protein LOC115651630 [Gopherus evgoodei]XP_030418703.1 uncharacterized protein LOC115651630 [Gopherus evgoodei]XP_030418794.1 uncharacterized protein LOC115651630 [Gopherus evgoodei]
MFCKIVACLYVLVSSAAVPRVDPRQNVWVTWANQTGQNIFCISMATPSDPFRTCLIGYPYLFPPDFVLYVSNYTLLKDDNSDVQSQNRTCQLLSRNNDLDEQCPGVLGNMLQGHIINNLNVSLAFPPQELEVLGSLPGRLSNTAKLSLGCFAFGGHNPVLHATYGWNFSAHAFLATHNVTPSVPFVQGNYCDSQGPGIGLKLQEWGIWNNGMPKMLPPGYFLICGDRAWQGIPSNPIGEPCYLGRLTLFAPSLRQLNDINVAYAPRNKHSINSFAPDCKDTIEFLDPVSHIFAAFLAPGVASAIALNNLEKLACWSIKQFNLTSEIITALLQDVDSIRHAVLQNRAAIDFLLLAQGHGCEDFEGMCCMNLSDHSYSIHALLQQLQANVNKLK